MAAGARDIFVSHRSKNPQWARWIAFTLEQAGYTVRLDEWDMRAGDNVEVYQDGALRASDGAANLIWWTIGGVRFAPGQLDDDVPAIRALAATDEIVRVGRPWPGRRLSRCHTGRCSGGNAAATIRGLVAPRPLAIGDAALALAAVLVVVLLLIA